MQTVSTCPEDNGSSFPDRSLGSKPKKKNLLDRLEEKLLSDNPTFDYQSLTYISQDYSNSSDSDEGYDWEFPPLLRNLMFCLEIWLNLNLTCQQNLILPQTGALSNLCTGWHKKSSIWKTRTSLEILLVINWTLFLTKCSLCMIFPPSFKSLSATLSFLCTFQDML